MKPAPAVLQAAKIDFIYISYNFNITLQAFNGFPCIELGGVL